MMRQHDRSEPLFYYFRLEDQVPENHLRRLIEKHVSYADERERLKWGCSETGRLLIDPELLLRILLIAYLHTQKNRFLPFLVLTDHTLIVPKFVLQLST